MLPLIHHTLSYALEHFQLTHTSKEIHPRKIASVCDNVA